MRLFWNKAHEDDKGPSKGGFAMLIGGRERLKIWFRKHVNYREPRKQSDYRAVRKAERLIYFGLMDSRMTGAPKAQGGDH